MAVTLVRKLQHTVLIVQSLRPRKFQPVNQSVSMGIALSQAFLINILGLYGHISLRSNARVPVAQLVRESSNQKALGSNPGWNSIFSISFFC